MPLANALIVGLPVGFAAFIMLTIASNWLGMGDGMAQWAFTHIPSYLLACAVGLFAIRRDLK